MLECWNNGIMGSVEMGCWLNGKIRFDEIIKNGLNPFFKTNIPTFHYSMIATRTQALNNLLDFHLVIEIPRP
jgi:hypothetical protein